MRILFLSSMGAAPWGGSEDLWAGAAHHLAAMGADVIACVHGWNERARELDALEGAGVRVMERWPVSTFGRLRRGVMRRMGLEQSQLQAMIQDSAPDFIVLSNGACLPDPEAIQCMLRGDVRFLNIGQANNAEQFVRDADLPAVRAFVEKAEAMCFVSDDNRRLFERQIGLRLERSVVVRNPYKVARDVDHSGSVPTDDGLVRFACVARLHPPSKGQDLLLDVLARPRWRARNVRLDFFGAGPHRQLVEDLARMFDLQDRIQLAGVCNDIGELWRTHHALVLPSRYEGLPLAVVEAMLCGRVVITSSEGGAKEIIEDGVTGFLATATNADALDVAMERAWSRRSEWPVIGTAARSRTLAAFPVDPCADFARRILDVAQRGRPAAVEMVAGWH